MKTVIFGNGPFASLVWYVLTNDSPHDVVGFTVDAPYLTDTSLHGLPVVAFEAVERHFPPETVEMIAPLGFRAQNAARAEKHDAGRAKGYRFISYVSARALTWPDLRIGENCLIFEAAIVQPFARLGDGVILRDGAQASHHVTIGNNSFLSGNCFVGGGAAIGERCFLGAHAVVNEGVSVADGCTIGAGAVVTADIDLPGVYLGVPAQRSNR